MFNIVAFIAIFTLVLASTNNGTIDKNVINYLTNFGYLDELEIQDPHSVTQAIKEFQIFIGIPPTGVVNELTISIITRPRCGFQDVFKTNSRHNTKNRWLHRNLTFSIGRISRHLTAKQVADNLQKSMNMWGKEAKLTFTRVYDTHKSDIVTFFASRAHGDGIPFDGPGGVLAHAFYPQDGDLHFDYDENWNTKSNRIGVDFFSVALHELGHSLGLGHSRTKGAVMFPTYNVYTHLTKEDINRIRELYS